VASDDGSCANIPVTSDDGSRANVQVTSDDGRCANIQLTSDDGRCGNIQVISDDGRCAFMTRLPCRIRIRLEWAVLHEVWQMMPQDAIVKFQLSMSLLMICLLVHMSLGSSTVSLCSKSRGVGLKARGAFLKFRTRNSRTSCNFTLVSMQAGR
jgi:hypothetical protein